MDNTAALCTRDRDMIYRFSDRCIERLTGHSLFSFPLSFATTYMNANVEKEIEKDRLIIEHAGAAFQAGKAVTPDDIARLFVRTTEVDRAFVEKISMPSLSIHIRYEDFAHIRKKRIEYLAGTTLDILRAWGRAATLDDALKKKYTRAQYRGIIAGLLHLYCLETGMLGRSVKFLPPFNKAMDMFMDELAEIMEEVKETVADDMAARCFQVANSRNRAV